MTLTTGTKLGPYEILAPIGKGGMGEVWKARDTRLGRDVAIKISAEKFTERFEREARAIAALNHPHICQLHDIGPNYLVMEHIEGHPLSGPLSLDQALKYAIQICDALDAAHKKGIIHRDLKPGNILVTKSGAKLLDFGLAIIKPVIAEGETTATMGITAKGQILGTLYYMSPEQLQGREADARSDIFSFGLVLYEMLTGKRAFEGKSPASIIAAILERETPSVSGVAPPALDRLLRRCLEKDPDNRWESARDLKTELEWIAAGDHAPSRGVSRRALLPWMAGSALAGAGAGGLATWAWRGRSSTAARQAIRFRMSLPEGVSLERAVIRQSLALSPFGGRVAMIATNERGPMVWVQRLDSLTANPVPGTEGARVVFWSPDAQFIGFWADGKMKKVSADGGTPLPIGDVPYAWSASWNRDDLISAQTAGGASSNLSAKSGAVSSGKSLFWPRLLPDGKRLLFINDHRVQVLELSTGRLTPLMPADTQAVFVPDQAGSSSGYLLFGRSATLLAQRFDAQRLRVMDEPVPVAKDVPFFRPTMWSEFDASWDGILVYSSGSQEAQLTWLDRGGRKLNAVGDPRDFFGDFQVSADGKKLVADVFDFSNGATDIWAYDLERATAQRVTFEPGAELNPVWSPDGKRFAFGAARTGAPELTMKTLSDRGIGDVFPHNVFQLPADWSSDGRLIFYCTTGGDVNGEIWVASVADRKVMSLLQTPFDSAFPVLSPNGEFLAFSTNETGRYEIYVQPFESRDSPKLTGERRRISQNGGNVPRWQRDGKELFFLSPDRRIMAVPVKPGADIEFGAPAALFQLPTSYRSLGPVTGGYEVSPDGQKFLVPIRAAATPLQVVVNWQAALRK